jgi:hypothetical protein
MSAAETALTGPFGDIDARTLTIVSENQAAGANGVEQIVGSVRVAVCATRNLLEVKVEDRATIGIVPDNFG